MGGVSHGKHPAVRLGLELHAARGKPSDGFLRSETGQRSDEGFSSPGIAEGKLPGIVTGVGDIAAAAAGNPHLRQKVDSFFQENDRGLGVFFRGRDGSKKSGGTSPGHHHAERFQNSSRAWATL